MIRKKKSILGAAILAAIAFSLTGCSSGDGKPMDAGADNSASPSADYSKAVQILSASTDGTDTLFQAFNDSFVSYWKDKTGQIVSVKQALAPSSKQLDDVSSGQSKADVITLGVGTDIDAIQSKGLINEGWQQRYDYNSSPYFTTVAFVVKAGNPKGIKEWDDVVKPGIQIVVANPKSYTDARWSYAGAWAYAYTKNSDEDSAKSFVTSLYKNAAALEADDAAAEAKFVDQGAGDVWITTEARGLALSNGSAKGKIEVIVPSTTLAVEPIVSVVDKNADADGSRDAANGYADYLFTEQAQTIAAQHYYRPRFASVVEQFASQFPERTVLTVDDNLSGWEDLNTAHFTQGGLFDQLTAK